MFKMKVASHANHYQLLERRNISKKQTKAIRSLVKFSILFSLLCCVIVISCIAYKTLTQTLDSMEKEIFRNRIEIQQLRSEASRFQKEENNDSENNFDDIPFEQLHSSRNSSRSKRQANGSGSSFLGAHLVGVSEGRNYYQSRSSTYCFKWSSFPPNGFSTINLEQSEAGETFIVIRKKGYYYVYSQVTYFTKGYTETGHQTVVFPTNSFANEPDTLVLMDSINNQNTGPSKQGNGNVQPSMDSDHHAGVFYLYPGDRVGVRPISTAIQKFLTTDSRSFFGLFYLG